VVHVKGVSSVSASKFWMEMWCPNLLWSWIISLLLLLSLVYTPTTSGNKAWFGLVRMGDIRRDCWYSSVNSTARAINEFNVKYIRKVTHFFNVFKVLVEMWCLDPLMVVLVIFYPLLLDMLC